MSAFSDEMAACALELLTEFGEAVIFTRTTQGAYNPTTGSTNTSSDAVFSGFGVPQDFDTRDIDGELVKESDIRVYVNATTTVPIPGDELLMGSTDYRIVNVRKFVINGEDVLYELQVRV